MNRAAVCLFHVSDRVRANFSTFKCDKHRTIQCKDKHVCLLNSHPSCSPACLQTKGSPPQPACSRTGAWLRGKCCLSRSVSHSGSPDTIETKKREDLIQGSMSMRGTKGTVYLDMQANVAHLARTRESAKFCHSIRTFWSKHCKDKLASQKVSAAHLAATQKWRREWEQKVAVQESWNARELQCQSGSAFQGVTMQACTSLPTVFWPCDSLKRVQGPNLLCSYHGQ